MDPVSSLGFAGALLVLIGFVLNEFGRLRAENWRYDLLNFLGGGLLVVYAWLLPSYPFLLLNLVWTLVALRDLLLPIIRKPTP